MSTYIINGGQLYHAEGKERKNHKYYNRILLPKKAGQKKNSYRYFYSRAEYLAYMRGKQTPNKNQNGNRQTPQTSEERYRSIQKANYSKKNTPQTSEEKYRGIQNANYTKKNSIGTSEQKYRNIQKTDYSKKYGQKTSEQLYREKQQNKNTPTATPEDNRFDDKNLTVKLPNGRTEQFDSIDEYQDYKERLDYQKNEPDFMKDVPDISDNRVYTKLDDQNQINEEYNYYEESRSMNCGNCSMAYELRRRGYDVQAKEVTDDYNGRADRIFDYFEDAEMLCIFGDGSTVSLDEERARKVWDHTATDDDFEGHDDELRAWTELQSFTPETIEKGIIDNNPPGSRGMIDVNWKSGGAHSIIYEVDLNGKVTIRDSQTFDQYGLEELADRVDHIRITRTDNLKLKEESLNAVEPNKRGKRTQYVDKRELKRLNRFGGGDI